MDRRQAAQLEWMRRNYALLTPEHRAIVDAAYGSPAKDPNRSTAEVSFGDDAPNVASDLDASATPMPAEPVLQPGRKRSRADWAVDAATAGELYSPAENVDAMSVGDRPSPADVTRAAASQGMTPPGYDAWAEAMTDAETGTTRAQRQAQAAETGRRIDRQKAQYDADTGYSPVVASLPDESGPYPGAGRPGYDRTFTPDELAAQRGSSPSGRPITETVPGPRGVGGLPVRPPRPIYDEEEATRYQERPFDTNTGKYKPSPKDRDMLERGMVPVLNEDGTVGYAVGYEDGSNNQIDRLNPLVPGLPGGPGRAGQRKDLENAGWGAQMVESPLGPTWIYAPGPDAKKRYQAQEDDRTRVRLAKRAGIRGSAAMGMDVGELRTRAKAAGIDDYNARNATWKAQAMLAGGQPTGGPRGTKALTNALLMIDDPEAQRRSLQYMLPGGALTAQVDARQLDMAAGLAQRALTGALAGTAQGPLAQAQAEMAQLQAQAERDKLRAQDEDILGDKYAKGGWLGYDEFTIAEQQQMYDDLIAQGYKPGEAQRAVDRQASKRRASQRQQWNP